MSDLTYKELEDSEQLIHRMEYARRLKEDIFMNERVIALAEQNGAVAEELRKTNKEMKDRLSVYDVYRQKSLYTCWRCNEAECVCDINQ